MQTVLNTTDVIATVPALLSAGDQTLELTASDEITALMPLGYDTEDLIYDVTLYEPDGVEAPTAVGTELGTVTVSYGERILGSSSLITVNATTRSEFAFMMQELKNLLSSIYVKFLIAVLIAVIFLFFVHEFAAAPRRRYQKLLKKWEKKYFRQTVSDLPENEKADGAEQPPAEQER